MLKVGLMDLGYSPFDVKEYYLLLFHLLGQGCLFASTSTHRIRSRASKSLPTPQKRNLHWKELFSLIMAYFCLRPTLMDQRVSSMVAPFCLILIVSYFLSASGNTEGESISCRWIGVMYL